MFCNLPAVLEKVTTRPRAFFTKGKNVLVTSIIPHRLTSAMRLKLSSGCQSIGDWIWIPALFTRPHSPKKEREYQKHLRSFNESANLIAPWYITNALSSKLWSNENQHAYQWENVLFHFISLFSPTRPRCLSDAPVSSQSLISMSKSSINIWIPEKHEIKADDFRYVKFIYLQCGEEMKLRDPRN